MTETFTYRAWAPDGRTVKSAIRAATRDDAMQILHERGLRPISVSPQRTGLTIETLFNRRPRQRLPFFRSLATMLEAAVPLRTICTILLEQAADELRAIPTWQPWRRAPAERFLNVLRDISHDIIEGLSISDAMLRRPREFTEVESTMVQAGESSGHTSTVLSQLAKYLEDDYEFTANMRGAMTYPVLVMCLGLVAAIILAFFVAPQFATFFTQLHAPLPPPMRILLGLQHLLTTPIDLAVIAAILLVTSTLFIRYTRTPTGSARLDLFRLKMPLFGRLIKLRALVTITKSFAMLLRAGHLTPHALTMLAGITGSPTFATIITNAKRRLEDGVSHNLTDAIHNEPFLDPVFKGYVRVGEQTASLPDMFDRLGTYYQAEANAMLASLPKVMEFVLMVFLGILVGSVVIPIMTSILSLYSTLAQ